MEKFISSARQVFKITLNTIQGEKKIKLGSLANKLEPLLMTLEVNEGVLRKTL